MEDFESIEQSEENANEELMVEHIAAMVGEGYTCGYDPYWSLTVGG